MTDTARICHPFQPTEECRGCQIVRLEAEVARLREGLRSHGTHLDSCAWWMPTTMIKAVCDCGLNALLATELEGRG